MSKSYEELTFADDFMFCKVLQNNPELCKEMTELFLGRRIGEIVTINKQKPVEITADGRGVRFDIYMEDEDNTVYNIEMQAGEVTNLPFRTRYYQGMIDLDQMERGAKFEELKKSYIIFICLDNPFPDKGLHKYSFRHVCRECADLELGDGSEKILLSTAGDKDDISEDLKAFLDYVAGKLPKSELTKRLEDLVEKARKHIEWRKEYMTLLERDERMREEGRAEGEIIGTIRFCHDELDLSSSQIVEKIMSRFSLERSDAEKYVMKALEPLKV